MHGHSLKGALGLMGREIRTVVGGESRKGRDRPRMVVEGERQTKDGGRGRDRPRMVVEGERQTKDGGRGRDQGWW